MPFAQDAKLVLPRQRLSELMQAISARGYRLIGPKLEQGAIVYAELCDASELPVGFTDQQAPGHYRAERRTDASVFGYAVGPRSFRSFFQQARQELFPLRRDAQGPALGAEAPSSAAAAVPPVTSTHDARPLALFGARACDLVGLGVLDRVLVGGDYPDPRYRARREGSLVIAVHCNEPSGTCFCVSQGGSPTAERDFDLALRELLDADGHRFLVQVGSERGAELVAPLGLHQASAPELAQDGELAASARTRMGRTLDTRGVERMLKGNLEHPEWDAVADRCLACSNCTMVCPTCFCTTTEDRVDLNGSALREQRHDSCFTREYSHMHGGPVRESIKARYRQWLVHKFSTWHDQFGSSGCVGCGRCISACPVGIDVTEELARIAVHAN